MDWDLILRFIACGALFVRVPCFLAAFRVQDRQKTNTLLKGVGATEKALLMTREHPNGYCAERTQKLNNSYRLRSSLCATLLKCRIQY
jgi:hypothetical protein